MCEEEVQPRNNRMIKKKILDFNDWTLLAQRTAEQIWTQHFSLTCRRPANLTTPHPRRLVSGSTRLIWYTSTARNLWAWPPSLLTTIQAMRSLLSEREMTMSMHRWVIQVQVWLNMCHRYICDLKEMQYHLLGPNVLHLNIWDIQFA